MVNESDDMFGFRISETKSKLHSLPLFKNSSGLALQLPEEFIKRNALSEKDIISCQFTLYKLHMSEETQNKYELFFQRLGELEPGLKEARFGIFLRLWIRQISCSLIKKGVCLPGIPSSFEKALKEKDLKLESDADDAKLIQILDLLINKHQEETNKIIKEVFRD